MDQAWATAHSNFLSSLSPEEFSALTARAKRTSYQKHDQIFSAGDSANAIYIVTEGSVKLYQLSPGGKEIILWFGFSGELFGIAEAVRRVEREIFAAANVDCEVLVLSERNFVAFLRDYPEAAMRAIGILSARVRELGFLFADLAADDVETRLIKQLLRFAAGALPAPCDSRSGDEVCLNIELTHTDLANLIGATRQTVNSTLASLRRRGLVILIDRHIHIVDSDRFSQLLEAP
ncbi:MAG: Crp/Fnr family transcriptional regulator [Aestuariivirgaceae bacterium]